MTMTITFAHREPTSGNIVRTAVLSIASGVLAWRANRARRIALVSLLDMDTHRLDDLGIAVADVHQALSR